MSIFAKDCPQCAETNPAYALRCRCGFAFGSTDPAAEAEADAELTLQEEKLYQEYLAARAEQAAVAASDAAKVAAAQPANRLKAREAEQAEQAAVRAKAELEAQTARLTASMQAAGPSRTQPATEPVSAPRPTTPMKTLQSDLPPPPRQQASEVKRNGSPLATALTSPEEDPGASAKPSSAAAGKGSVGVAPATGAGTRISGAPAPAADGEHADKASTVSSAAVQRPAERADAEPSSQTECNVPATSAANTGTNRENSASAATSTARPTKTATWLFADNDSPSSDATPGLSAESEQAAATGQSANTIAERSTPNANNASTTASKAEAAARAKKLEEMLKGAQARRLARSERVAPGSAATASKTPPTKTPSKTPASVPTDTPSHPEDTAAKTAGAIDEAKAQTANTGQTTANTPTVAVKKVEELHDAASAGNPISARPAVQPAKATATPKVATQSASATNPEKAARPQATETASTQANRVNEPATTSDTDKAKIAPQAPEAAVPAGQNPNARQELEAALEALEARAPATPASQTVPATDTNEHAGQTRNDVASADTPAATDQAEQTPARTPVSPDSTQPPLPADKKDCPNCTTLLPIDAKRCRCGFEFPSNDEKMPALSLSDADVAALEGGIQPSGITRLG